MTNIFELFSKLVKSFLEKSALCSAPCGTVSPPAEISIDDDDLLSSDYIVRKYDGFIPARKNRDEF